jgi:hypothetical protein
MPGGHLVAGFGVALHGAACLRLGRRAAGLCGAPALKRRFDAFAVIRL